MAGGGGSTGGIGAQSPASGGFGGNMGNASAGGFGGGYGGGMGFGGQPQTPMGGLERPQVSYFGDNMLSNMGNNTRLGNNSQLGQLGNQFGQLGNMANIPQPEIGMPGGQGGQTIYGDGAPTPDVYRPQNPMPQPSMGGIEQDQDFRNFRSQHDDLSRQMNEYMQKAPMYQQLQELQGKMQGVQSKYAPQQSQRSFNRAPQQQRGFNPQQQLGGLAALLGGLGRR
jgi:hypothetical protein